MNREFWLERWQKGQIGFHQDEPEARLVALFPRPAAGGERVLVPLCGKSLDMVWLAGQGCEVVGVELSRLACEAFFEENGVECTVRREGRFEVFRGGPYAIYCGDYFDLTPAELAGVSAYYDRAALIALPPEMRSRYVVHLRALLSDRAPRGLVLAIEYPEGLMQPPPFSVSPAEVESLYAWLRPRHVEGLDVTSYFFDEPAQGRVLQHAYLLG
jgi:thiopurine S-methyltransferase